MIILRETQFAWLIGVPLEELLFALSFGFYWASVYEHFNRYKIIEVKRS